MNRIWFATLFALTSLMVTVSCNDIENDSPCTASGGLEISNQSGKIYKWMNSEPHFYYIGGKQDVTSGINGGLIPCSELPNEFQQEGLLVKYSGVNKGTRPDTGDPLFGYIYLRSIEKEN